jgi:two-component system, OmpR family, sensor histidine kinase BaeS
MGERTAVRWRDRLSSRLGVAFMATALAAVAIVTAVALTASSTGIAELAAEQRTAVAHDVVAALEAAYLGADGWADADLLPAHTLAAAAGAVLIVTTPDLGELPAPPELGTTRRRLQAPEHAGPGDAGDVSPPLGDVERRPGRATGDRSSDVGGSGEGDPAGVPRVSPDDRSGVDAGAGGSGTSGSGSGTDGSGGTGNRASGDTDGTHVQGDASLTDTSPAGPGTGTDPRRPSEETSPLPSGGARRDPEASAAPTAVLATPAALATTPSLAVLDAQPPRATPTALGGADEDLPAGAELLERIDLAILADGDAVGTATLLFVAREQPDPAAGFRASLLPRLLLGAAAAALLALFVTGFVTLRLTRPLRRLTDDVDQLRDGPRPPPPSRATRPSAPGEIGVLRAAIDQMADDLRRQERLRRALIADVGHELRTPVTILLAELEAIRDGVLAADDDQLGSLHEEVQRIARLVEDVASLADAEAAGFALGRECLDLAAVTEAAARAFEAPLRAGGVTLTTALEPVAVEGDRRRLEQVVRNLVTNAAKFAPPDTTVEVSVRTDGEDAVIEVRDRGPGFLPDELPFVFDRFWRGREAISTGGSGIGLAVVAEVAAAHGGSATAANRPEGGACLTVRLPRTSAPVPVPVAGPPGR